MGNSEVVWDQKKYVPYQPPKKIVLKTTNNLNKLAYLYPLQCKDEENLMAQYNIYCLRKKSLECHHIVNILDTFHQNSVMSCFNKPYNLSVIIEPIPWILEDQKFNTLTFIQCLYLIQGCFIGFIQIEKIVNEEFTITGRMIGINEECQVKVWFNQNFISNEPQFIPQRNNNNFKLYTQILKIIEPYCYESQSYNKLRENISIYVEKKKNQSEQTELQLAYQYFCDILCSLGISKFSDQTMFPIFFNNKKFLFDNIAQISGKCYLRSQSRNTIYVQNPNQHSSKYFIQNPTIQNLYFKAKTKQNILYDQTTIRSPTRDSILKNHNKKNKQVKSLKSWKNSLSKIQAERRKYQENCIIKNYQKSSSKENLKFLQDFVFGDNTKQKNRNDNAKQNKMLEHAPSIVALFNEQQDSTVQNKLNKQKSTQRIKFPDKQKPRKMFFHNKKVCSSHSGNPDKGQNQANKRRQMKTIGPGNNQKFLRQSNTKNNRQENSGIYRGQNMIGEYSQITIQQSQCSKSRIQPQPKKQKNHQIKVKHTKSHKQESIISDLKNEQDSWISYKVPNAGKYATLVGSFQYLKQKMNQNIKVCQSISSKQASFIKLKEKQNEQKSRMVDLTFNDNIVQSILNQNQIRQIKEQQEDLQQNHLHYDHQPVSLRHKGSHTDEFFNTKQSCKKYYQPGFITGLLNHKAKSIISQK